MIKFPFSINKIMMTFPVTFCTFNANHRFYGNSNMLQRRKIALGHPICPHNNLTLFKRKHLNKCRAQHAFQMRFFYLEDVMNRFERLLSIPSSTLFILKSPNEKKKTFSFDFIVGLFKYL